MQQISTSITNLDSVRRIFPGSNFLSKAEFFNSISVNASADETEDIIPYKLEQLRAAKDQNLMLVSMIPGFTMQSIVEATGNKTKDGKVLLFAGLGYEKKSLFMEIRTSSSPYFVAKEPLEDSSGSNYFKQTEMLSDWLMKNSHLSSEPLKILQRIGDFRKQKDVLWKCFRTDYPKGVRLLNELPLNRMHREKGCELLLRTVALSMKNVPLLEKDHIWLGDVSHSPAGEVAHLGKFTSHGGVLLPVHAKRSDRDRSLYPKIR
jgi:hypothetical protein